jgi:hypothetical protein
MARRFLRARARLSGEPVNAGPEKANALVDVRSLPENTIPTFAGRSTTIRPGPFRRVRVVSMFDRQRPLWRFDIETTGPHRGFDRICEVDRGQTHQADA